jgi:uncharacterized phiE125 gp8 family phage protein
MANFNNINDYSFSEEANDEPLSKEEVKIWLRIDGNDDNNVIENLITAARIIIENYLNQSLIKRTVTAHVNNTCGNIYLPFQPFVELVSIKDANGDDIAAGNYTLTGTLFKRLEYPCYDGIEVTYTAGVDEVTKLIHTGLLMQIAFMYENRGDSPMAGVGRTGSLVDIGISPMAKSILKGSRR